MKKRPNIWLKFLVRPLAWRFNAYWFRHAQSAFLLVGPLEFAMAWSLEADDTQCDYVAAHEAVSLKTNQSEK